MLLPLLLTPGTEAPMLSVRYDKSLSPRPARELIDENHSLGFLLADQGYESGPLYDYARARDVILRAPQCRK